MEAVELWQSLCDNHDSLKIIEAGIYELARTICESGISSMSIQEVDTAYHLMRHERSQLPQIQMYEEQSGLLTDAIKKIEREIMRA